ncbi:MAG TPA: hypothetical protein VFU05_08500 [Cyclobacteriaceae bacterium]|nr:hypothetical protein [Cyclobacteriaceae bacterium]
MNRNEYFYVFEAIIYGLALTEILTGLNRMIIFRKAIKVYWVHLALVFVYIELLVSQYAWEFYMNTFDLIDSAMTFLIFVVIFPISYYFGAYQIFPRNFENVDFKEYFHSHRKAILTPAIVMVIALVNKSIFEVVSSKGIEYFSQFIFSLEAWYVWQQTFFVFAISYATFSKKHWPSEVLAVFGLIAQTCIMLVKFRTV